MLITKIKKVLQNKVLVYLTTRYITYFIQFASSLLLAIKLGPYYFGILSFLLLLLNYLQITNFGISNSLNIFLIQNKTDEKKVKDLISSSYVLCAALSVLVILLSGAYFLFGYKYFEKYQVGNLFYIVGLTAIFLYINQIYITIYRVKNSLREISISQSIVPVLNLLLLFIFVGKKLLILILLSYLVGNAIAFLVFAKGKHLPKGGKPNFADMRLILGKGIYLFLYNLFFYLILVSVRTVISIFYSVENFGSFAFSFTLANSFILLLEAFSFILFPKLIDKLYSTDYNVIRRTIEELRANYVILIHGIVYSALVFMPIVLAHIPKYQNSIMSFSLIALTMMVYNSALGYLSFLMARNKEKQIAFVSFGCLLLNIVSAYFLSSYFHIHYAYVILATLVSYFLYANICVYLARRLLGMSLSFIAVLNDFLPVKLLVPYILFLSLTLLGLHKFLIIPFGIFVFLNFRNIKDIVNTFKKIIHRPDFINL